MSLTTPDDTYDAETAYEDEPRESRFWSRHAAVLVLIAILAVAAFFRFYGRDYDQGHGQNPDERAVVDRSLQVNWPSSFDQLFNAETSPMNVRSTGRYPWGVVVAPF